MTLIRSGLTVPIAVAASLVLVLAAIVPVLAAPGGATSSRVTALTDHTTDCNVTFDTEGNLLLDGEALAGAELAAVEALLAANTDLAVALGAAADADAEGCVNLVIEEGDGGLTAIINADISFCPATVAVNADGDLVLNGHVFPGDLVGSELAALIEAAATAEIDLFCSLIEITDNAVSATVLLEACASVTLNNEQQVTIDIGGIQFLLEADAVLGADMELEVGATVEAGVALRATLDLEFDSLAVMATLIDLEGCGDDTGGGGVPTATPAQSAAPLPDTATHVNSATNLAAVLLGVLGVLALGALGYPRAARRRR